MIFLRNSKNGAVHAHLPEQGITLPVSSIPLYSVLQAVGKATPGTVVGLTPEQMTIWFGWQARIESERVRLGKLGAA